MNINQISCEATDQRRRTHLRLVAEDDAAFIVGLRTDEALSQHLSAVDPSVTKQRDWIKRYKAREAALQELYFIIVHEAHPVGAVRMYNFRGLPGEPQSLFEWGSWIVGLPRPPGAALYSAICIYEIGFEALQFSGATFEVLKDNAGVIKFHQRSGAQTTHEGDRNFYFRYTPEQFADFRASVEPMVRRNREIFSPQASE